MEIAIRAPLDTVWSHSQRPELHERWDLRFTRIEYLPRLTPQDPQTFRYSTRLGFGLEIAGEGESTGQRDLPDGTRASSLTFASADRRSLILAGSGYWKYVPTGQGTRFLTAYDYRQRYGALGKAFDRLVFRPLIGWATAWSFDRLRLWIEQEVEPEAAFRSALIHALARIALAFVFIYQGIVPKLLARDAIEVALLAAGGVPPHLMSIAISLLGIAETLLGLCLIALWRSRWPLFVTLALMVAATATVIVLGPSYLTAAFNPVSLNVAVASIAVIDLMVEMETIPSASHCLREPPSEKP